MTDSKMQQRGGEASTNIQVGGNLQMGLTLSEVREVALDVFKANYPRLAEEAMAVVMQRANDFLDRYFGRLVVEVPQALKQVNDPAYQSAVYNSQSGYARTGDEEVMNMLIELLIQRASTETRSLEQIVLDESLTIVPKLTPGIISLMTLVYVVRNHEWTHIRSPKQLAALLNQAYSSFGDIRVISDQDFQHIEYCGCGTRSFSLHRQIRDIIHERYRGVFGSGVGRSWVDTLTDPDLRELFVPHWKDDNLLQINALNENDVKAWTHVSPPETREDLLNLFNSEGYVGTPIDAEGILTRYQPGLSRFLTLWGVTSLENTHLTSVGIAIARANYYLVMGKTTEGE